MLGFPLFSQFRNINPDATIDHIIKTWLNDHCLSDPDDRTLREDESSFYLSPSFPFKPFSCLNSSCQLLEGDCSSPVLSAPVPVSLSCWVPGKASAGQPLFPSLAFSLLWIRLLNRILCLVSCPFWALKKNILVFLQWILLVVSQTLPFPQHL